VAKNLIQELLRLNLAHSVLFVGQKTARERHHVIHPTNIAAFKCMDGRVNLAVLTQTPLGIIRPFRNIGGIFDLGWTALNAQLREYVETSVAKGRKILLLVTYHYAEGNPHRGCRGHEYDVKRATQSAQKLVHQIRGVFEGDNGIYPILVGVETDHQKLLIHGTQGQVVSLADLTDDGELMKDVLRNLCPDMHPDIVPDLLPLMLGNVRHVQEVREADLELEDLEHKERTIAIGQGFEWVPHNWALVINDLELTLDDTIGKAAGIIKGNLEAGRIPKEKALLVASVPYQDDGYVRRLAVERAKHLTDLGLTSILKFHPDLVGFFETLTAVQDYRSRRLEVIEY
jgi:hypothetical protein